MYQQTINRDGSVSNAQVKRLSDNAFIPFDPANTDYAEYLKWLEAGNAPLGADTPLPNDSVTDPQEQ